MLLLAWSLFHHAIRFGRRRRLFSVLSECLAPPLLQPSIGDTDTTTARQRRRGSFRNGSCGNPTTSSSCVKRICCRITRPSSSYQQLFHTANTVLHRVPSEPILSRKNTGENSRKIYCDGQREIVMDDETHFCSSDWSFEGPLSYYASFRPDDHRVYFSVRISSSIASMAIPSSSLSDQMPSNGNFLDSFARSIAKHRTNHSFHLYTAPISAFIELVFCWSEGTLFEREMSIHVEEIRTISPSSIFSAQKDLRFRLPRRRLSASLPARPLSLLELLFVKESVECEKIEKSALNGYPLRQCNASRERAISRFSTTALPIYKLAGSTPNSTRLPNYLKIMRRKKCNSGGDEMSSSSNSEIVSQSLCSKLASGTLSGINDVNLSTTRVADDTFGEMLENVSTVSVLKERDVIQPHYRTDHSHFNNSPSFCARGAGVGSQNAFYVRRHSREKGVAKAQNEAPSADDSLFHSALMKSSASSSTIGCSTSDVIAGATSNNSVQSELHGTGTLSSTAMGSKALAPPPPGHCHLSRSASLLPSSAASDLRAPTSADAMRRRSLSPLTLSLLVNYGGHAHTVGDGSVHSAATLLAADPHFPGKLPHRRVQSTPRRSFASVCEGSEEAGRYNANSDGTISSTSAAQPTTGDGNRPRQKPPSLLVYCGDRNALFDEIREALRRIVPTDTYTISALSTKALLVHPWMDLCACLIIADTSRLDNAAWNRLQMYFVNSGKILFVCENSLLSSLTSSNSQREQSTLLKNAFGNKAVTATMGKEFGNFLKQALKGLTKHGQVNETFYAHDAVGDTRFSVVLHKKKDQPLLLYMQNLGQQASALFSDATTEQLLSADDGSLIRDALHRLGLKDIQQKSLPSDKNCPPPLSSGYLIAARDLTILDIPGMTYGKVLGCAMPGLIFHRSDCHQSIVHEDADDRSVANLNTSVASDQLLPVEVRRRRDGLPLDGLPRQQHWFDVEQYFRLLATKRLGRVLLYVPVCRTTMEVANSLSRAFPLFDGILVVAGTQLAGRGRGGNDWISPVGCASFTFNFNIPFDSNLGRSIGFLQHITAVSVASAVSKLLHDEIPDFPIRLKWPNDIYYGRSYKLGGLIVQASQCDSNFCCAVGVGLNVANAKPTVCINDMLPVHSNRQLTVEEVLAQTMTEFEHFVNVFENKGRAQFLKSYYRFWMHSHEEVQILRRDDGETREKVVIRGLDEHGYLEVRSKETGQIMSVMDDGNTFDMFHGLIVPKGR
uniref:BPL/LPL catalytic domain-containing protein n=1 Tax=Globodera pallida TaxID=36090 RepID=A0A183BMT3_GLOPA